MLRLTYLHGKMKWTEITSPHKRACYRKKIKYHEGCRIYTDINCHAHTISSFHVKIRRTISWISLRLFCCALSATYHLKLTARRNATHRHPQTPTDTRLRRSGACRVSVPSGPSVPWRGCCTREAQSWESRKYCGDLSGAAETFPWRVYLQSVNTRVTQNTVKRLGHLPRAVTHHLRLSLCDLNVGGFFLHVCFGNEKGEGVIEKILISCI